MSARGRNAARASIVAIVLIACACSRVSREQDDLNEVALPPLDASTAPSFVPSIMVSTRDLALRLDMEKATTLIGEPLRAELSLKNISSRPQRLEFPTDQRFELWLSRDPDGKEAVAWASQGDEAGHHYLEFFLSPGAVLSRKLEIPTVRGLDDGTSTTIAPGNYFVTASLAGTPMLRTPGIGVTISEPTALDSDK